MCIQFALSLSFSNKPPSVRFLLPPRDSFPFSPLMPQFSPIHKTLQAFHLLHPHPPLGKFVFSQFLAIPLKIFCFLLNIACMYHYLKPSLQTRADLLQFLYSFLSEHSHSHHLHVLYGYFLQQSQVVEAKTIRPEKSKIFTNFGL